MMTPLPHASTCAEMAKREDMLANLHCRAMLRFLGIEYYVQARHQERRMWDALKAAEEWRQRAEEQKA